MLAVIIFRNVGQLQFPEILAIAISRNVSNHSYYKYWRQMLAIVFFEKATNDNNYNFQNCQQLYVPEILTSTTCRNPGNMLFEIVTITISRIVSNQDPDNMVFRNVSSYNFPYRLAIIISRNVGNYNFLNFQQSYVLEMLATNVIKYLFWKMRRVLTITFF